MNSSASAEVIDKKKENNDKHKIISKNLNFYYGDAIALKNISMDIPETKLLLSLDHRVVVNRLF